MYVIEVNFVEYDTVILKTLLLQKLWQK
jgi:hypothetical protein